MVELNPNHAMTQAVREQWQKIAALLLHKLGGVERITYEDVQAFSGADGQGQAIAIEEKSDGIHVRLISMAEAARLSETAGGRVN